MMMTDGESNHHHHHHHHHRGPPATEKSRLLSGDEGNTDHHHHPHDKTLGEDVPLYAPPQQRQRWNDLQVLPHVNWGDLFFDLFYVAAAYNLAILLKESQSTMEGLAYFLVCFLVVYMIWSEKVVLDSRFASADDNLFHRSLDVILILLVATTIQHIQPVDIMKNTTSNSTMLVFCSCLIGITLVQIVQYKDVVRNVMGGDEARYHARYDMHRKYCSLIPFTMAALTALVDIVRVHPMFHGGSSSTDDDAVDGGAIDETHEASDKQYYYGNHHVPILLCFVAFLAETTKEFLDGWYFIPRSGRHFKELRVPLNLEFIVHRMGEWTMLMLGESILSLLMLASNNESKEEGQLQHHVFRYYMTFYSGVLSVTMMQYLFFRSQPSRMEDHAMRRNRIGGYQFAYAFQLYSATLIMMGCSFKMILHYYLLEDEEGQDKQNHMDGLKEAQVQRIANLFSWSLATSFLLLDIMVIAHRGWKANLSRLFIHINDDDDDDNGRRCKIHWTPVLILLVNYGLIATMGSLSSLLWKMTTITSSSSSLSSSLEYLTVAGAVLITCQVLLRTLGLRFFPVSKVAMRRATLTFIVHREREAII